MLKTQKAKAQDISYIGPNRLYSSVSCSEALVQTGGRRYWVQCDPLFQEIIRFLPNLWRLFLPDPKPQQRQVTNTFDPKKYLSRAERILKCDVEHFAQSRRLSGAEKDIRDLLLYCIWATGQLKNEQIGKLIGLSYSAVSHAVKSAKSKLARDRQLQTKFDQLNSLFKL